MTGPDPIPSPLRRRFHAWERVITALYLLGVGGLVLAVSFTPVRERVFWRVDRALRATDARWVARLDAAEAGLATGDLDEAVQRLVALDRRFPAPTARGALDRERERLLALLARGYEAQGRKGAALRTWERLAVYDPRNYRNHVAHGDALARLDGTWTLPVEARDAYARALAIHPVHLPALRGALQYDFDRGDFAAVLTRWEHSLEALPVLVLPVQVGDSTTRVTVPFDGRPHDVEVAFPRGAPGRSIVLRTAGLPGVWETARVEFPRRAGRRAEEDALQIPGPGAFAAGDTLVTLALPPGASPVARLRLRLRLLRPVDEATWRMVATSYRNRLDAAGLSASAGRVRLVADQALADRLEVPWP